MNRARYFALRIVQTVLLLWIVITLLFVLFKSLPGDFVDVLAVTGADPESLRAIERKWGLNQPLHVQYWQYMSNFVQLDFGKSFQYNKSVVEHVRMRIFNTFILVAPAVTFTYVLGSLIGAVLGSQRGSKLEKYGLVPLILGGSFPTFFTSLVLIILFASWIPLFPTSGMVDPAVQTQFKDAAWWRVYTTQSFLHHYTLPFVAVVVRYLYFPSTVMRTSVVEIMDKEHVYYHRVKGLPTLNRLRHIGKNSILPVVTMYPVSMARGISGLVLIEIVFNWPGIGYTLVESVIGRDFPVLMFVFFVAAAFVILANFVVDVVYGIIDPRVSITD